jgi:Tol biopolymer transport system component
MQLDTQESRKITVDQADDLDPIWSPDGSKVAFISERGNELGIWQVSAFVDGTPMQLKSLGSAAKDLKGMPVILKSWQDGGRTIYYEWNKNLYSVDLPSGTVKPVTHFDPSMSHAYQFRISPDTQWIVYRDTQERQTDLWLINPAGDKQIKLTDDSETEAVPVWCSDSRHVVYSSTRDDLLQVFVIDIYERTPRQVTFGRGRGYTSDVSPDNTRIFLYGIDFESDLFLNNLQLGAERALTRSVGREFWPLISPDESTIVFQMIGSDKEEWAPEATNLVMKGLGPDDRVSQVAKGGFLGKWSPITHRLAFLRRGPDGFLNIWTTPGPGFQEKQLTTGGVAFQGFSPGPPADVVIPSDYSWSPVGNEIAYSSRRSKLSNIWVVSADTPLFGADSPVEKKWTDTQDAGAILFNPIWDATGQNIAYVSKTSSGPVEKVSTWSIWLSDGTQQKLIYSSQSKLRLLGWTEDSSQVVIVSADSGPDSNDKPSTLDILSISVTRGSNVHISTLKNTYLSSLRMSSKRNLIGFVFAKEGLTNISILSLEGRETVLTDNRDNNIFYAGLSWSPDGASLCYEKETLSTIITMLTGFR